MTTHDYGVCPYCGSTQMTHGTMEFLEDGLVCYPVVCDECDKEFTEYYELTYVCTEGNEE